MNTLPRTVAFQISQSISAIGDAPSLLDVQSKTQLPIIKINAPINISLLKKPQKDPKYISNKNPYTTTTTGYQINRQLFSQQQLRQAFKLIDVNKDDKLTSDDLSFILNCMGMQHSREEVEEMIRMVSGESLGVGLDDFRKIGKGKIIPMAGVRMMEGNHRNKQSILGNMKSSLITQQQVQVIDKMGEELSYSQFLKEKARRNELVQLQISQEDQEQQRLMVIRTSSAIKNKRRQFAKVKMVNLQELINVLQSARQEYLSAKELSDLLTISQDQAKILFFDQKKRIKPKQALLDAILCSPKLPIKKLQLVLTYGGLGQALIYEQWLACLVFMLGRDQSELISKRLSAILKHRKMNLGHSFDKHFIVQVMSQEISLFPW